MFCVAMLNVLCEIQFIKHKLLCSESLKGSLTFQIFCSTRIYLEIKKICNMIIL